VARYLEAFGEQVAADLPAEEVPADWRRQNVLVSCQIGSDGEILDSPTQLCATRSSNAALLAAHGMAHFDIAEITLRRRDVTSEIVTDAYNELGCAGIPFPSTPASTAYPTGY
jgi:hypothetical protein